MGLLEVLQELGMDEDELLCRFSQSRPLIEKFMRKFAEAPTCHSLAEAVTAGDGDAAFYASHTLKGVSANLGFSRLFSLTSQMAEHLRSGDSSQMQQNFNAVAHEYSRIAQRLSKLT